MDMPGDINAWYLYGDSRDRERAKSPLLEKTARSGAPLGWLFRGLLLFCEFLGNKKGGLSAALISTL
jgi:hypothetical protein